MKTRLSLILGSLFLLSQAAMAQTTDTLTVSATIPDASGLQLTVTPVNASSGVAGTSSTTATTIPFGTLTFNTTNNIYEPTDYYTVAIGATGGAGTPTVNVTYTEGNNPNNPGTSTNGLGTKATATFLTVASNGAQTVSSLGKKRLIDLTGTAGAMGTPPSGSYEQVDVGIWTGSTTAPADPTNGQPFSNTDVAGTYTGTLTFTATSL
jgi:hypothetical protein